TPLAFMVRRPMLEMPQYLSAQVVIGLDEDLAQLGTRDDLLRRIGISVAAPADQQEAADDIGFGAPAHGRHRPGEKTWFQALVKGSARRAGGPENAIPERIAVVAFVVHY